MGVAEYTSRILDRHFGTPEIDETQAEREAEAREGIRKWIAAPAYREFRERLDQQIAGNPMEPGDVVSVNYRIGYLEGLRLVQHWLDATEREAMELPK